jgi:hypothetical protein
LFPGYFRRTAGNFGSGLHSVTSLVFVMLVLYGVYCCRRSRCCRLYYFVLLLAHIPNL